MKKKQKKESKLFQHANMILPLTISIVSEPEVSNNELIQIDFDVFSILEKKNTIRKSYECCASARRYIDIDKITS